MKGKKYVVQGARVKCSMGTVTNCLNTDVGHGICYQGKPILNANDHLPMVNLMPFGMCGNKPCVPCTPLVWRFCNEEYMIDGAQALTTDSVCVRTGRRNQHRGGYSGSRRRRKGSLYAGRAKKVWD